MARRCWYWSALSRPGAPLLHLVDWEVPLPRPGAGLTVRSAGLWADHVCEAPFQQWTVANEAYAVALDDPEDALGRAYGVATPIALDVEWYAAGPASAVPGGYEQRGEVHGVVELGDGPLELDGLPAHRTHRWGDDLTMPSAAPAVAHLGLRAPGPPARRLGGRSGADRRRLAGPCATLLTHEDRGVSESGTVESITLAELVLHRGEIVHEEYAPTAGPDTTLISWSTAKSVTQALVGIAVRDGLLDLDAPAPVPEWADDERSAITLRQLLHMSSGLRFVEDYVDDSISHCIDMLFGAGQADVAGYAAALPLDHPPGSVFNYSSGTTNIVSRIVGQAVGGGEAGMRAFMQDELFGPLGMTSADPRFDAAGTFIGSSFLYCTARDFARFGQLYLADGVWEGRRLLPEGWVDLARTPAPVPVEEEFGYGAHWWLWDGHGFPGTFAAHGYEGQYIIVRPDRDLVVVRLGKTPVEVRPPVIERLQELLDAW